MNFVITHYGKNVDELNEKEKMLLTIDTVMTTLFMKKKEGGLEPMEDIICSSLSDKRNRIVLNIMGWEQGETREERLELLERMEQTKYSYSKFLKDMRSNVKKHDEMERVSMLN